MNGYLSVVGSESGAVRVDSTVEIYRDPDMSHEIVARTKGKVIPLGVQDITVSRLSGGSLPVVIEPRQSYIEISNGGNTNGVTVVSDEETVELDEGRTTRVNDVAKITVGYQTEFRLTVEREFKTEIEVEGDVKGDFVAGDQKNVDQSTTVDDSVVNRSSIDGESDDNTDMTQPEDGNDPNDDTDTRNWCETHDLFYTGDTCPECADEQQSLGTGKIKFCMFCGTEIPATASVCPDCGERLSGK